MRVEQLTRDLLGPADPAIGAVPPPRLSALEVIAEAGDREPRQRPRVSRRWVLATGVAVVTGGAISAVAASRRVGPRPTDAAGTVLVPIAYQFEHNPPEAAARLRALADHLGDAPYDRHSGRYAYHRLKTFGDPIMVAGDGRHTVGFASDEQIWTLDDGSGLQRVTQLPPQYPDEESRAYWAPRLAATIPSGPQDTTLPAMAFVPFPTDHAGLVEFLDVQYGPSAVAKQVDTAFRRYVVPRAMRSETLRILAGVPGLSWRGDVTDRAGRSGVAITYDDREHDIQSLLIFDPRTGVLLAMEHLSLGYRIVSAYDMIVDTDRTDRIG
jgi:hypothetical protein